MEDDSSAQSQPCGLEPAARSSGLDAGGSGARGWVVVETGMTMDPCYLITEDLPGRLRPICAVEHGHPRAEELARLIAQTPNLLEKLKRLTAACVEDFGTPDDGDEDDEPVGRGLDSEMAVKFGHIRDALAAIAKAEGRS